MKEKIVERIQKAIDMEGTMSLRMQGNEDDGNAVAQFFVPTDVEKDDDKILIYSDHNLYSVNIGDVEEVIEDEFCCHGAATNIVLSFEW